MLHDNDSNNTAASSIFNKLQCIQYVQRVNGLIYTVGALLSILNFLLWVNSEEFNVLAVEFTLFCLCASFQPDYPK